MSNNKSLILTELYKRTVFSAYDFEAISFGSEWLDSCLDLMPIDMDPIDESYKNFKHFDHLEGILIMNENITHLKHTNLFEIAPSFDKLARFPENKIKEDLLFKFHQDINLLPSKILVTNLTFVSNPFHIMDYFTKANDRLYGDIYYKE